MTRNPHARATSSRAAVAAAGVAAALGIASAALSAYWALGGTGLLDTIGGAIERWARDGGPSVVIVLWLVVVLKLGVAVAAPVIAAPPGRLPAWMGGRVPRLLSWTAALVLAGYGGVLTGAGLLVETGLVAAGPETDRRALAWHTYLWDPWFLVWGIAFLACLWLTRDGTVQRR